MIKNYFLTALRQFWRNKIFSFINIAGLSIGISAALVIYLIVHFDFSFDHFEKDQERIYRVVTDIKSAGTPFYISGVQGPMPEAVHKEVTGIETSTGFQQFIGAGNVTVMNHGEKPAFFKGQPDIVFADPDYFQLLSYKWLEGSPQVSFREPMQVVLTEQRAQIYFPGVKLADVIGRRIVYDDSIITNVSGVVKKLEENTDFTFKEFISISTLSGKGLKNMYNLDSWQGINSASQLFLKLSPGIPPAKIEAQLNALVKKYDKLSNSDGKSASMSRLQPLNDLHFDSTYGNFGDRVANKPTMYALLAVSGFLLILGCINFISLTTAQSSKRAKEIGIRKTMGSSAKRLMLQFLSETFLITLISAVVSLFLTPLLMKVFADFIPNDLHFNIFHHPDLALFLIGLVLTVSFLAGFYPALVLSRYNPVAVLKSQFYSDKSGTGKVILRKGLTVFQFFIAQVFVMATMVTIKQIHFMVNKDMGFKKDAIISFNVPYNFRAHKPDVKRYVLLDLLKAIPGIQLVSIGNAPAGSGWSTSVMTYKNDKKEITTDVKQKTGDSNYIKLFHLKLLAGKNVEQSDTTKEYLINETYMHLLGFQKPQEVLNKLINNKPVVGVISDFNMQSLHKTIDPLAFSGNVQYNPSIHVALRPQDADGLLWKSTIADIQKSYKKVYPGDDFNYEFFDESIARFYKSEQDISKLLTWASGLAVFISCLGLFGLVIYTTYTRTKEIGVRKVLGASVSQIILVLSKDFMILLSIAFVVAVPIAWWAMHRWLQNFAYKTSMSWWVFLASGILMIIVALISMGVQTVKAANANPVKSLRTE